VASHTHHFYGHRPAAKRIGRSVRGGSGVSTSTATSSWAGMSLGLSLLLSPQRRRTGMGKIVMSENVSLDGVIEEPPGDEGFTRGGWVGLIAAREEVAKVALDEALAAEALLLGRRSYEWLAARWPSRSGELADRLNTLPKYVVSSTLKNPDWNNSTVLA